MSENPIRKRIKIAIEPIEEKKVWVVTSDGNERIKPEPTKEEEFANAVRRINFDKLDSNNKTSNDNSEKKEEETSKPVIPQFPWQPVLEPLHNARVEIEHMLMMLNLMLNVNPSPLTLQYMSKPHPLQYPDLAVRELAKKKELESAAGILSSGANRLKTIINRERDYFEDLLKIRPDWLLINKQVPSAKKMTAVPKLYIDYSWKTVGSKEKVEAEITETLQGRVSLLFPTSHIYKNIYVYRNNSQFHEQLRNEKKFVEPSEHDLSLKLYYAQRSQYLTELFHKLSRDCTLLNYPFVNIIENELKIDINHSHSITIHLVNYLKLHNIPFSRVDNKSNVTNKDTFLPSAVIQILLQQLARNIYNNQLTHIPDLSIPKDTTERDSGMLKFLIELFQHYSLCQQLRVTLLKIADNIPSLFVHCYATTKPTISSMELQFGKRITIDIMIDKTTIYCSSGMSHSVLYSPKDVTSYVLFQITKQLVEDTFKEANFYYKNKVRKDHSSVSIIFKHKKITIGYHTKDHTTIDITMSEVLEDSKNFLKQVFRWYQVPGNTVTDKIRYLLANSATESIGTILKPNVKQIKINFHAPPKRPPPTPASLIASQTKENYSHMLGHLPIKDLHNVPPSMLPINGNYGNSKTDEIMVVPMEPIVEVINIDDEFDIKGLNHNSNSNHHNGL